MAKKNISQILAENLVETRSRRKMTQEDLSDLSGIPRSTLTHLESGSGNPSLQTLSRLTQALKLSIEELLTPQRPVVHLFEAENIPVRINHNGIFIQKLIPEKIPGVEFEKLELAAKMRLKGTPHRNGTREYFYCAKGKILIYVEGARYEVRTGQLLAFPGDRPHVYENPTTTKAWGVGVVAV